MVSKLNLIIIVQARKTDIQIRILSGNLNLNSRSLTCLPRFLFESHLGITPDPLNLVPNSNDTSPQDQQVKSTIPSWEAQDLSSLKAADNAILELHHEVSLFGGIKHLDVSEFDFNFNFNG